MWMSHVSHMNEPSCQTYESVTTHIWMSHVTHLNKSRHTYEWVTHMNKSRCTYKCFMLHAHACRTHMAESCHARAAEVLASFGIKSRTWTSHVTHMNESRCTYEWESCHTYEWVMSHIWMSNGTHINESCHTYEWVTLQIRMSHVTHIWLSYVTYCSGSLGEFRNHCGCAGAGLCGNKKDLYLWKETFVYIKRNLDVYEKRPLYT